MPLRTISAPGLYYQDTDLTQSNPNDDAILITSNYVTLINRARIVGAGGVGSNNSGIRVLNGAAVTILNHGGSVRGFTYGLSAYNAYLLRVDGLFVQDALFRGIKIEGDDAYVAHCDIREVHGAMFTPFAYCMGIEMSGMSSGGGKAKVLRNSVQNVHGTTSGGNTGESVGISITDLNIDAVVQGNLIQNDNKPGLAFGHGASIGVWVGGASKVLVAENVIRTWDQGLIASSPTSLGHGQNLYANCTVDATTGGATIPTTED